MRNILFITVALSVGACAGPQPSAYDEAREVYLRCLQNVSPAGNCDRYARVYAVERDAAAIRTARESVDQQNQANTSAWGRWAMDRQRMTTCTRWAGGYTCQ